MRNTINRQEVKKRQRLRRLYSLGDFQLALSAADFLSECDPDETYSKVELRRFRCYETTVIVAYTRPFSKLKDEVPPLTLKMTGAKLNEEQKALHRTLMKLRNKVFVYSHAEMMRIISKTHPTTFDSGFEFTFLETVFDEALTFFGPELLRLNELLGIVHHSLYTRLVKEVQRHPKDFNLHKDYLQK